MRAVRRACVFIFNVPVLRVFVYLLRIGDLHEVRSELVDDCAEGEAVSPRRRHVGHLHTSVALRHLFTPLEQVLHRGGARGLLLQSRLQTQDVVQPKITQTPSHHGPGYSSGVENFVSLETKHCQVNEVSWRSATGVCLQVSVNFVEPC